MPKKLNEKMQEEFLNLFGNKDHYYDIRRSCKEAKIGKSTLYRWMQNPEFKKEIKNIKTRRRKDPYYHLKSFHNIRAIMRILKMSGRGY